MDDEEPIEPQLAICDPHHHLWDYPDSTYLVGELKADASGLDVRRTVFVECGSAYLTGGPEELRPVGETAWVAGLAGDGFADAIVGFADLTLGAAVEEVLTAHVEAGGGRFRGIRHASAWDASPTIRPSHTHPPPGLLGLHSFRRGFAALGRMGLTFDAWLYFRQIPELVELTRAHPEVDVVVDHLGGPSGIGPYEGRREAVLATWRAHMTELAASPGVRVKLGGIGMPIYGMDWHHRRQPPSSAEVEQVWGPAVRWVVDLFGPDRCMFESNFPVDRRSLGYRTLWNAFVRMSVGYAPDERRALFHDTACRFYRLS